MNQLFINRELILLISVAIAISPTNKVFSQSINQEIVNTHNQWREKVGAPPLSWSNQLAQTAQDWANQLASQGGNIYHRPNNSYGENIFWISGKQATPSEVVNAWGSEIKYFKNGTFPNVSTTGNWADVGHYTQVIWKNTTTVGCGVARSNKFEIWVCNYNPPGNYQGQNP
ncbi:CAP family protein [Geminocystis sp. NIES-3709]|uniref:CAP family protein n=1 Tax=Geminocystis sp. NIES-3709 TaxID=1617448 RepID=UPI0005FC3D7C|nr:CAP family protein [Geminocystis sp. NIES-3709]BAQ64317.1 pathogenesis-related protein 1C precursor [Geminocystis sp. NIES-3709]